MHLWQDVFYTLVSQNLYAVVVVVDPFIFLIIDIARPRPVAATIRRTKLVDNK